MGMLWSPSVAKRGGERSLVSGPGLKKIPWAFIGRIVAAVGILAFLLSRVDLSHYGAVLRQALGYWLAAAFLMYALPLVTSALKWGHLLRALRVLISTRLLLQLYAIGFFISSFLPGVVGGDVVRSYMAGQDVGGHVKVAATVVVERVTGVVALLLLCLLALLWDAPHLATLPTVALLGSISAALIVSLALGLNRRLALGLMYRTRRRRISRAIRPLYQLHNTLKHFPRRPLVVALGYSLLFYLQGALAFLMLCRAFGVQLSVVEAASVQVFRSLLLLIPISLGGLGLGQAGDVYLLGMLGVGGAHALGMSLARQAINYSYALLAGVCFIRWQSHPNVSAGIDPECRPLASHAVSQQ
ncbi:MAG TPA: lysylphosphatidylglycerol synthase transmembrane domain-containing protein [Alphaproteobacteria bacterium]|nr:lysylphosphatidylglycerol synthase transmembrane domain-containing protein [Alphaproteobacteria bacterium]